MNKRAADAVRIGVSIRNERLKNQTTLPETIVKDERVRCWDRGQEAYRLVPKSEIARNPDWFIIDEETWRYEA